MFPIKVFALCLTLFFGATFSHADQHTRDRRDKCETYLKSAPVEDDRAIPIDIERDYPRTQEGEFVLYPILDGEDIGVLAYTVTLNPRGQKVLTVERIEMAEEFRQRGLSKILLGQMLEDHPRTISVEANLTGTNWSVFKKARRAGMSALTAAQMTPFFLAMEKLGFAQVDSLTENDDFAEIRLRRPTLN